MDLKLSLKGSWNFTKESIVKRGAWIDTTREVGQLIIVNENREIKKENLLQGSIEGTFDKYYGTALSLNIMNIKPLVARGTVGFKAVTSANVIYSNTNSNDSLMCLKGDFSAGLKASFHAGLSAKLKLNTTWLKGKSFGGGVSYDKVVEGSPFFKSKYDGCKTEALDFSITQQKDGRITLDNIVLKNLNGTPRTVDVNTISWEIYRKAPFELLETFSATDSIDISTLDYKHYVVILKVEDENGIELIKIKEFENNAAPTANAGADQNANLGDTVTLNGSGIDSDGSIVSYQWTEGASVLGNTDTLTKSDFSLGVHTLTLTVVDDKNATGTDTVKVNIAPLVNQPPVANAGTDISVDEGKTVVLDGSGSSDADGSIVSYEWKEGSVAVGNDVTVSLDNLSVGSHIYTLTVTDNDGTTVSDSVNVVVQGIIGTWIEKPLAPWSGRGYHVGIVFKNKIWVMGGSGYGHNNVWSSQDGTNWTEETEDAPWRYLSTSTNVVFKNKIWVFADDSVDIDGVYHNGIWSSPDGRNWTREAVAPWRVTQNYRSVVFKNKIWVMGGPVYDDELYPRIRDGKEVWSSFDGKEWTKEPNAPWDGRYLHRSVVFDNKIFVLGGFAKDMNGNGGDTNDVWSSDNALIFSDNYS